MKVLSEVELDRLMRKATAKGWSAEGRPEWFQYHRSQFEAAALVVFGPETGPGYRCIATVILGDGSGGRFTLDVQKSDYHALKDMDEHAMTFLVQRYLETFPPVGLDASQAQTWDSSVWRNWETRD